MIRKIANLLFDLRDRQRVNIALAKGSAMMPARQIDLTTPESWEFSGFSQNGEDGILDVLRSQLLSSNRYFIEIGAADGIENNSAWLVVAEKYNGILVEGNSRLLERARSVVAPYSIGVECHNIFVTRESARQLKSLALNHDPDVFSLDIDGNDYYVAQSLFNEGFRPKIFVVEYNSVFGPDRSVTIEYQQDFVMGQGDVSELYYGVSISGWKNFFSKTGYRFVTVDRNGVNAFFVDPACFPADFLDRIEGLAYAENRYQYTKFKRPSAEQFLLIPSNKRLVEI
jgi:hypothetical protein